MMDRASDQRLAGRLARLKRHWRWVLPGAGLCGSAALLVSLFLPKIYRATTDLLVSESKIGPTAELPAWQYATLPTYEPFVNNDAMIRQAIDRFHLDQAPYELTVDTFRRKDILDVRTLKSTRLVEISVEFPDARVAAELANFFARGAVDLNDHMNITGSTASRAFLAQQLEEAKTLLAEADKRRTESRARGRIEDREKELTILLSEKEKLSGQAQSLQLALVQDEGRAKYLHDALSREPDTFRLTKTLLSDRVAEKLLEKPDHGNDPPASISEETLNTIKEKLRNDFAEARADAESEKEGAREASVRLEKVNERLGSLLANLPVIRGEIDKADYECKLARDAVEIANRNYQNALVNASAKNQDIEQLAPAVVPEKPVRPRLFLNLLLGTLFGLIFLSGAASVRENLRELRQAGWDDLEEGRHVRVHVSS